MRMIMLVVYLGLILIGVSFSALNASDVVVNFYFKTISMPIAFLMIVMLGIGLLLGFFMGLTHFWRLKRAYRKIQHQLTMTEKEIQNLRVIPLRDQH